MSVPAWPRSITVRLPGLPPSSNNAYLNRPGKGRILSPEARAWKEQAGWLTRQAMAGVDLPAPPFTLSLFAYGLSRKRDLDGIVKLAQDSVLEALGVDDRHVDILHAYRVPGKAEPRLDVVVSEVG